MVFLSPLFSNVRIGPFRGSVEWVKRDRRAGSRAMSRVVLSGLPHVNTELHPPRPAAQENNGHLRDAREWQRADSQISCCATGQGRTGNAQQHVPASFSPKSSPRQLPIQAIPTVCRRVLHHPVAKSVVQPSSGSMCRGWQVVGIEGRGRHLERFGGPSPTENTVHVGENLPKLEVLAALEGELLLGLA